MSKVLFENGARVRVFTHTLALLLLGATPASAIQLCDVYAKVAGAIFPHKRDASQADYDKALAFWAHELPKDGSPSMDMVLAKLQEKGDANPETLMALMDTLNPTAKVSFSEWMKRLEAKGIEVRFRRDTDVEKLEDHHKTKWKWNLSKQVPPLSRKPYLLEVRAPDTVPTDAKALFTRLYNLSVSLPSALLDVTADRATLLSYPAGKGPDSYPAQLRDAILAVETQVYETLHEWESRWGERPVELDFYGPWEWLGGYWTSPVPLAWKLIFPFYHPTRGHRPSELNFLLYEKGGSSSDSPLAQRIDSQYAVPGTVKWTVDQQIRIYKALAAYALARGMIQAYHFFTNGMLQASQSAGQTLVDGISDEDLNEGLKAYEENEEGDPIVNEIYNKDIDALNKIIQEKGDPDGSLTKERDQLIKDRDFFKN